MLDKKDYTSLSQEELLAKQRTLTNWQKIFVGIAVVLVAQTLWSVYKHTSNMHPFLILGSLFLIVNNSSNLKKVEAEIVKRKN